MAKRVFFSFHYQDVIDFRANVVRQHWVTKPDREDAGFFDASVWEIWTPLAIGARLHIPPPAAANDPLLLADTINENGVTIAQFVPSLLQAILDQVPRSPAFECDHLFCGGEALAPALAARAARLARKGLVNLYGPTETTIDALFWRYPAEGAERVAIGPMSNV